MQTTLGRKNRNLNPVLLALINRKPKRFTINSGIVPTVKAIPARSHHSAGSIASGYVTCVLCVR